MIMGVMIIGRPNMDNNHGLHSFFWHEMKSFLIVMYFQFLLERNAIKTDKNQMDNNSLEEE